MKTLGELEKSIIVSSIRDVPDFPKPGIMFKDITTLLNNHEAYSMLMTHFYERYKEYNLDFIAGIESRGFIFGSALAASLGGILAVAIAVGIMESIMARLRLVRIPQLLAMAGAFAALACLLSVSQAA